MSDPDPPALTRAELLGGLSGRRVSLLLFSIQQRTAYVALRARHAVAPAICEWQVAERERTFLTALASARGLETEPDIRLLERFACSWAHLAPRDAATRADLAQRFGERYRFRHSDVPGVREALGLDDAAVESAYQARYGRSLSTIYATSSTAGERIRWRATGAAAWLENLPRSGPPSA